MTSLVEASRLLQAAANQLSSVSECADVRESGAASFVYAKAGARAIELSSTGDAWWVEFWAGEIVAEDRTYTSHGDAVQSCRSWLEGRDAT
jgi:hypothetical protein